MKKLLNFLMRYGILALCISYAIWGVDWAQFIHAVRQFGFIAIFITLIYGFIQYLPVAWRLDYLTHFKAGFVNALNASVFCLGINNIFPAKLGEVAKAFYLRHKTGISLGRGLGLIFWERFFDINFLLLLGLISAWFLKKNIALAPLITIVGGIWAAVVVFRIWPQAAVLISYLIPKERFQLLFADIIRQLQKRVGLAFFMIMTGYTALAWLFFASVYYLVILWAAHLSLSFVQVLAVFAVATVGFVIPSTPGGLGIYEAAVILSMGWFGIDRETALAVALVLRLINSGPPTLAALFVLAESGLSMHGIRAHNQKS
ncbi:glycosyltransferase 2 family protein [Desulfovibrionales bacterium]